MNEKRCKAGFSGGNPGFPFTAGLAKKNSKAGARVRNLGPGGIKEVQGQAEE